MSYRNYSTALIKIMLCSLLLACFLPATSIAKKSNIDAKVMHNSPFNIPRSHTVKIQDKQRTYKLYIKLPKGYKSSANRDVNYPVIYLTDAMYTFQIMSGVTRFPMNAKQMAPAIIVGISWELGMQGDTSRVRDYTPSVDHSWRKVTGGADRHIKFLQHRVIPYVEQNYRTDPEQRTYVGNSLGGLFGGYILSKQPELFRNYLLGSPSFWWQQQSLLSQLNRNREALTKLNANVFVGIGALEHNGKGGDSEFDMLGDAKQFTALLENAAKSQPQQTLNTKLLVINEAHHATAFATTAIHGMDWLFNHKQGKSLANSNNEEVPAAERESF
ncbi:alpha/beta hydrolase [Shewanella fidelis]|uniref:Alpha/beta hydrolase-fold protein n=1 Tax=Shewanella fidelis TaxID=173509 RepID=A0AAW8NTW6_9GAMM|nr:alpha/beta hydrolase-fold protein [Shewanella fidelis]MDR8525334.1 alpha/beta hydrolase-fold protein [Shewanella fidelis]MDW4813629.1 alpha/beta hydrolase-fold protein [Shewanella fidelis]MDW4817713.1 alpha/beta hydrolase-fold protein [Shewanella fidelis]MDW4821780.1 alpha/beta hydrolase-fold protein [Shewanella fidelis]MDW4825957.1 alpha/beta hydrolase-fold protein [Shewanella fidelis]